MQGNVSFSSTLEPLALATFVERMLDNYLPDGRALPYPVFPLIEPTLERLEHCFSRIERKYYNADGVARFDHLNSDHMAMFLYMLANTSWRQTGDTELPTKLFYLNKILNGLDLYFSVALPDVFLLVHPVGTVIGNASYSDYLVVYQNCTVGADNGVYPTFGEGTILFSRSSVLGDVTVGANVVFAANSFVVNTAVPADSIVVGQFPQHRFLPNPRSVRNRVFDAAS